MHTKQIDQVTRRAFLSLLAVLFLLIAGCVHYPGRIQNEKLLGLKLGMTIDQVVQLLGKPQSVAIQDQTKIFRYFVDQGNYVFVYQNLTFVQDRLVSVVAEKPKLGGVEWR